MTSDITPGRVAAGVPHDLAPPSITAFLTRPTAAAALALAAVGGMLTVPAPPPVQAASRVAPGLVYQLSSYQDGTLDAIAAQPAGTVVVDLARDGATGYWTADEIARVKSSGKRILAYFEVGAIEDYRPEWSIVLAKGLATTSVGGWPHERYAKFWEPEWYATVVKPRALRAAAMGFDGVYLDEVVAYEETPDAVLAAARLTRRDAARHMVSLLARLRRDLDAVRPGMLVVPQNAPELRAIPGYVESIDGIGMEDLFFADNKRCAESWCQANLLDALALRDAGKFVLAIDYTTDPRQRAQVCTQYRGYGFTGVATVRAADVIPRTCPR